VRFFTLYEMLRPAALVGSIAMLRNQSLKPEFAGFAEQVGADFALFEIAHEDAIRPASQQPGQIGFAH